MKKNPTKRNQTLSGRRHADSHMDDVNKMNRDEVLKLFESRAAVLEKTYFRSQDTVLLLAEVIAHCSAYMSKEDFDALVHIGGTLVKQDNAQARGRAEVTATMQNSQDSAPRSQS